MSDMERADDFLIVTGQIDVGTAAADHFLFASPRNFQVVKMYAIKDGATTGAAVITLESSIGDLTDTLTVPTGGAADDIASQHFRLETNNAFTEGTRLVLKGDGGAAGGDTVAFTIVCRPL